MDVVESGFMFDEASLCTMEASELLEFHINPRENFFFEDFGNADVDGNASYCGVVKLLARLLAEEEAAGAGDVL